MKESSREGEEPVWFRERKVEGFSGKENLGGNFTLENLRRGFRRIKKQGSDALIDALIQN